MKKDRYDAAIEYLTDAPEEIIDAWSNPTTHPAGCLFSYASNSETAEEAFCGCLTQIRNSFAFSAPTAELTEAIRADKRIPYNEEDIKVRNLPVFAEWQRRLDKELNR